MGKTKCKRVFVTSKIFNEHTKCNEIIEKEYIICDVCGHANEPNNAQCEMCSNYLDYAVEEGK